MAFLQDAKAPLRLAINGHDGAPRLVSLWYVWDGKALWCATPAQAITSVQLARDGRCAFEVSTNQPPYRGVRGTGVAELLPERGRDVLGAVMSRYLTERNASLRDRLSQRSGEEVAIRVVPDSMFAWDFSSRMVSESDDT